MEGRSEIKPIRFSFRETTLFSRRVATVAMLPSHSRGAIGALGQAGRTAPGFSTMAEKHHPGEIGPPKTCESLPASCYVSPNLLENNEVRILDSHSALALGLLR